jgi:hypothetical protein
VNIKNVCIPKPLMFMLILFSGICSADSLDSSGTIGSDIEGRIVATFKTIKRDTNGLLDAFVFDLENVSDDAYELYLEPEQFDRGAIFLLDPSLTINSSQRLQSGPEYLASIFDDDGFSRPHFRDGPSSLVLLKPGEKHEYVLYFNDYIHFDKLDEIDKVNIYVRASIPFYDEGADFRLVEPVAYIAVRHRQSNVALVN